MSVYAANRLASITEDSQFCEEIVEAFADTTRESANITNFGVIAQLHENDMRMFDAIISADFASVSNGKLLEGAELAAVNEKMEKVTGSAIWAKIKSAIEAIKNAIVAVARKIRDKVSELIKADKKILERYEKPINDADKIEAKINFAFPKKSTDEIKTAAEKSFAKIVDGAKKINDNISDSETVTAARKEMDDATDKLIKDVDDIFVKTDNMTVDKGEAKISLEELKTGKATIKALKESADKAYKAVKEVEKAAKAAQNKKGDDAAVAANVYKIVSGVGSSVHKAMATVNNAAVKTLAAHRKVVLAAGRYALAPKKVSESFVMENLFLCSDQYVAEMCEMI